MMWTRLAAVPASSSESICDGLRSAPIGASKEDAGQRTGRLGTAHMAAQSRIAMVAMRTS